MAKQAVRYFLVIAALMGLLCAGCEKRAGKETSNTTPYASLREDIVSRIQKGEIHADANGVAALPEEFKSAATDGTVYIAKDPALGLVVAFNLSMARSSRTEYLLYLEHDLAPDTKNVKAGSLEVNIAGKMKSNWYRAVRFGR